MSVMHKIFGSLGLGTPVANPNPAATPQQAAPVQPGNIPAQQTNPASANNPTVPAAAAGATAQDPTKADTPNLDQFKDMWNIPDDQKAKAPDSPFAGITPEAIKEVAGKTDFSKVVTPEMMTAISAGGEQAAAAMLQALNATSQQVYAQSAEASMKLTEVALSKQREQFMSELPNIIKSQTVNENLSNANPVFKNPAAAPMLNMLQKQLQEKNPTASATEIQKQAQDYLAAFAQTINPQQTPQQQQQQQGSKGTDFSDWS